MTYTTRKILILFFTSARSILLSGCFLRSLSGNVGAEGGEYIARLSANSLVASCEVYDTPVKGYVDCVYAFQGEPSPILHSTGQLISHFGLLGVIVDPLILQLPDTASNFRASFQNSPTPRDAVITVTDSFTVTPGVVVTAEPGYQFVILEFPEDVAPTLPGGDPLEGAEFDFQLAFDVPTQEPVEVKGMFTGKVQVQGQSYYVPLLPCVTDFSAIPAIEIPADSFPHFLIPQIINHINSGGDMTCSDQVYDFTAAGQPSLLYLPFAARP